VYELAVEGRFSAAHTLSIRGEREPLHGHDWHVTATFAGPDLDPDGLLCDFHALEGALGRVLTPLRNTNLNELEPFRERNASAENVARHIALGLEMELKGGLPPGVSLVGVRVTEAPGCAAVYRP
jgi:6-pyruvoyltetrahydropterin/6-carboxytetrahydropterin synthase